MGLHSIDYGLGHGLTFHRSASVQLPDAIVVVVDGPLELAQFGCTCTELITVNLITVIVCLGLAALVILLPGNFLGPPWGVSVEARSF